MKREMENEFKILTKLQSECKKEGEDTLEYYCDCMLKLWRIFYKIKKTGMLSYIDRIMSPIFPLMVQYFDNRIKAYFQTEIGKQKVEIGEDIERSVVTFWEVQEAIIQSSNGADRILFQSAPLDSGAHYVAPKLCSYYSEVLNSFSELFIDEGDSENHYAFCVYPSLSSQAEAERLFTTMEQKGKVGIIRVPGRDIADSRYIMALLFHEFFHVIPGSLLRLRKDRAKYLINILLYDYMEMMKKGLDIEEEGKEKLRDYLFGELINEVIKKVHDTDEQDRFFYSRNIMEYFTNSILNCLRSQKKNTLVDMIEHMVHLEKSDSFSEYKKRRDAIKKNYDQLNENISIICSSLVVQKKCSFYMGVFREAYADLLFVISLNLSPVQYFETFRYGQDGSDKYHKRIGLFLRVFCVNEVMSDTEVDCSNWHGETFKKWREWNPQEENSETRNIKNLIKEVLYVTEIYKCESDFDTGGQRIIVDHVNDDDIEVLPNKVILKRYVEYFKKCRDCFLKYMKEHDDKVCLFEHQYMLDNLLDKEALNTKISFRAWEAECHNKNE